MSQLKVGLLGLGRGGRRVAEVLLDSSWCKLIAVGSSQPWRTEQFTKEHSDVNAYDDLRSLIVGNPLDALFVASPPYLRPKYLALAAERRIPVWMLTPPARRFDEAIQITQMAERADSPIAVSRAFGIEPALQRETLGLEQIGRLFLARVEIMWCETSDLDWRADSQNAGGGVLLDRAYPAIDTLVALMGLPHTVYARMASAAPPWRRNPSDTEDIAVVVCQFGQGAVATINACWTAGPTTESIMVHGVGGSLQITAQEVVIRDINGERELHRQSRSPNLLRPQIEDFLSELASSPHRLRSLVRQHLSSMAVMEAAYLSARTGQPESTATVFAIHDLANYPASG